MGQCSRFFIGHVHNNNRSSHWQRKSLPGVKCHVMSSELRVLQSCGLWDEAVPEPGGVQGYNSFELSISLFHFNIFNLS